MIQYLTKIFYQDLVEHNFISFFYKDEVLIGGKRYIDGVVSMRFPSREVIDTFDPTDIIVLTNCTIDTEDSIIEKLLTPLVVKGLPVPIQEGIISGSARMLHHLNQLRADTSRRYVIVWSDDIKTNEMNSEKLRKAASNAYDHMMKVLKVYGT